MASATNAPSKVAISVCMGWRFGGGRHGERIDIGFKCAQLFLSRYAELLLFVDDKQSQVVPFYGLSYKLVRANDDVYLACGEVV